MKFIKTTFSGGLGNQLFQYATARALMKKGDLLLFDTSNYSNDYLERNFTLHHYEVKGRILSNRYLKKIFTPLTKANRFIDRFGLFGHIKEQGFSVHEKLVEQCRLFTTIEGYWQSESYFISIREQLLREMEPHCVTNFPACMQHSETVAVHVRREDYLKDDRYGFLGEDYYRNALNIIKQKLSNPTIIFFSDDMLWCKKVFENDSIFFCEDPVWKDDFLQLYLMSKCKHQVIANSSFSWWGAWLNKNVNKIVIRPAEPFRDVSLYYENHYPSDWIAI